MKQEYRRIIKAFKTKQFITIGMFDIDFSCTCKYPPITITNTDYAKDWYKYCSPDAYKNERFKIQMLLSELGVWPL